MSASTGAGAAASSSSSSSTHQAVPGTRSVTIPSDVPGGEPVTVELRTASPATLALRERVKRVLLAAYHVWKAMPGKLTGLIGSPEVLNEVVHCATAFHCNSNGGVDVYWVKKDMPREALKHAEVAYWTKRAGPAPQYEQDAVQKFKRIPAAALEYIRSTNDHDFISHYIYPFLDFWFIVIVHIVIWCGGIIIIIILVIVQPTLIVVESAKMLPLLQELVERKLVREDVSDADWARALNGDFDLDFLKSICQIDVVEDEWDEWALRGDDYLQVMGIPCILRYGPRPHDVALCIPKYDPYGPYHVASVSNAMIRLDVACRLMIALAEDTIAKKGPAPLGEGRLEYLLEVRHEIMTRADQKGIFKNLLEKKVLASQANLGFYGTRIRSESSGVVQKTGPCAPGTRPQRGNIVAIGPKASEQRKAWVIEKINALREQLEGGRTMKLLACPKAFAHGSDKHAAWLFHAVSEGAELINAASAHGTVASTSDDPEERKKQQQMHDATGAATVKIDTHVQTALAAIAVLASPPPPKKGSPIYRCTCLYCSQVWLIKDAKSQAFHDCTVLRSKYLPMLQAKLESQKLVEEAATAEAEDEEVAQAEAETDREVKPQDLRLGVTRCIPFIVYPWDFGSRVDSDSQVFKDAWEQSKHVQTRRAGLQAPEWERLVDTRGRISARALDHQQFRYPAQLIASTALAPEVFKNIKGCTAVTVADWAKDAKKEMSWKLAESKAAATCQDKFIIYKNDDPKRASWAEEQALDIVQGSKLPALKKAESSLEGLLGAAQHRIAVDQLRPYHYDFETGVDRLALQQTPAVAGPVAGTSPGAADSASSTASGHTSPGVAQATGSTAIGK